MPGRLLNFILSLLVALNAAAFNRDFYAPSSRLAEGRWVRVAVKSSGPIMISNRQLREMGFADPQRVGVFGYGALRISDILSRDNFIDDLPAVPATLTSAGLTFYANGPEMLTLSQTGAVGQSLNPYSTVGYYYLSDSSEPLREEPLISTVKSGNPVDVATGFAFHEVDLVNYGSTGTLFVGEDLRTQPTRRISLDLQGVVDGTEASLSVTLASRTTSASRVAISVGDKLLTPAAGYEVASSGSSSYGKLTTIPLRFAAETNRADVTVSFSAGGLFHAANIDALTINYSRRLSLADGPIRFLSDASALIFSDAPADMVVYDITDPAAPRPLATESTAQGAVVRNPFSGRRLYAAWSPSADIPAVDSWQSVAQQNLHAQLIEGNPRMIIIYAPGLARQAREIAALHAEVDGMNVLLADQRKIFNEFSSGSPDPGAFRRFLKMAVDTGCDSLQYALILGRGFFDNRLVSSQLPFADDFRTPIWQSEESLSENISYTSDDLLAQLDDGAGLRPASDVYRLAIGRIPARNASDADNYIAKLRRYMLSNPEGSWRNNVIMLADDGDLGVHLTQTEQQIDRMSASPIGSRLVYDKIYLDAYPLKGGVCVNGRTLLHEAIDRGAVWWSYTGHANRYYLSSQNVMTLNDINSMSNRYQPIFFGATCYFMQWDDVQQSGAEKMLFNSAGGVITAISATRPVFISENVILARELAAEAFATDESGRVQPVGMAMMKSKNRLASPAAETNSNKLRYVLMGDPAMRPAVANSQIVVDQINDSDVENPIEIAGRQTMRLRGHILADDGSRDCNFNGRLNLTLFDADSSQITIGRTIDGTEGRQMIFDSHGALLNTVADTVVAGEWQAQLTVPENIADNYRPTTLSLYAAAGSNNAAGLFRNIYLTGVDFTAGSDTIPPVIERLYINSPDFASGAAVPPSATLFATISDETALNLSTYGIGRTMSLRIDNDKALTDIVNHFTPAVTDEGQSGSIVYTLPELADGQHEMTLTVFDAAGNRASQMVEFTTDSRLLPEIVDIYTDANPATASANFYITHNRPDEPLNITICVYNLLGHLVWTSTRQTMSELTTSAPITWNLLDRAGRRVNRGIYIYRAEINYNGRRILSPARKLAVAAQ